MKELWTQDLRDRLSEYEVPVPANLWNDIETAMAQRRAIPRISLRKVAAVLVLLLAAATTIWLLMHDEADNAVSTVAQQPTTDPTANVTEQLAATLDEPTNPEQTVANHTSEGLQTIHSRRQHTMDEETVLASAENRRFVDEVTANDVADTTATLNLPTNTDEQSVAHAADASHQQSTGHIPSVNNIITSKAFSPVRDYEVIKKNEQYQGIMLALNASGMTVSGIGKVTEDYDDLYSALPNVSTSGGQNNVDGPDGCNEHPNGSSNEEQVKNKKFYHPISVGLQVATPLSDRWYLHTGLSYSLLRSETDYGTSRSHKLTTQRLHYVGIPIMINYHYYRNHAINLYVGAGGRIDFGISGSYKVEHYVTDKLESTTSKGTIQLPIIYSLSISPGIQLHLYKGMNLYAEPTLQYNVQSSKRTETYYTCHPWMMDLRFGLRWNIGYEE